MKKIWISLLLIGTISLSCIACGKNTQTEPENIPSTESTSQDSEQLSLSEEETESQTEDEPAMVINDALYDVSENEMTEITGIDLPAPEGATDVVYNIIDASSSTPIAEMEFVLDGHTAYIRAQYTGLLPWSDPTEEDLSVDELRNMGPDEDYDISGLYYDWDTECTAEVSYCDAYTYYDSKSKTGMIIWLDIVPGVLYNCCMEEGASPEILLDLANQSFVPLQGDA